MSLGTGSSCSSLCQGPGGQGTRSSALASQVGTVGSGRPLVPPAPSPLPPESLSELTAGCSGEEGHSPGSTGLCRGRPGREGRERPLCGCALPRERGSGDDAWVTGSGARWLLSLLSLLLRLPKRLLPCPAGSSCLALQRTAAAPREAMFPAERKERQERNQSSVEERERQRRRERTREPDRIWLHQWDQWLPSVR